MRKYILHGAERGRHRAKQFYQVWRYFRMIISASSDGPSSIVSSNICMTRSFLVRSKMLKDHHIVENLEKISCNIVLDKTIGLDLSVDAKEFFFFRFDFVNCRIKIIGF